MTAPLATPCAGCQAAPRRSHRVCSADQCHQGRTPCPCPAACELPEPYHLQDEPLSTAEALLMWACTALGALLVAAVILAAAP